MTHDTLAVSVSRHFQGWPVKYEAFTVSPMFTLRNIRDTVKASTAPRWNPEIARVKTCRRVQCLRNHWLKWGVGHWHRLLQNIARPHMHVCVCVCVNGSTMECWPSRHTGTRIHSRSKMLIHTKMQKIRSMPIRYRKKQITNRASITSSLILASV